MSVNDAKENNDPKDAFKHMLDIIDEVVLYYGSSSARIRKLEDAKARWMRLEVEWAEKRANALNPFRDLPEDEMSMSMKLRPED